MKVVPIGIDNFKRIIDGDYYYVDKTKVIEELLTKSSSVVLFTRPRRFGKSLLLSTLDYFFNVENCKENKYLFNDLYISKSQYFSEQGKYPVIHLDFKDLKGEDFESIYASFKSLMSKVYSKNDYIVSGLKEEEKVIFNNIVFKNASIDDYKELVLDKVTTINEYVIVFYGKKAIVR